MNKTETQTNFEKVIKDMMSLIEAQNVTVKDAKYLVIRSINLLERYNEIKRSRDNWRKKYGVLRDGKASKLKNGFHGAFNRPCRLCDESFSPTGRYARLCPKCIKKRQREGAIKRSQALGSRFIDRV